MFTTLTMFATAAFHPLLPLTAAATIASMASPKKLATAVLIAAVAVVIVMYVLPMIYGTYLWMHAPQ